MKPTMLYRIASVLLIVFATGNMYGLLRFWQVAVLNPVPFPVGHQPLTYAQVVLGLGLFCSLCVLFGAYLAWHLGTLARTAPQAIGTLGWVLFAYQLVGVVISWIAFAGPVLILSVVIAVCVGWATWLARSVALAPAK
jgi:hypothetical protein